MLSFFPRASLSLVKFSSIRLSRLRNHSYSFLRFQAHVTTPRVWKQGESLNEPSDISLRDPFNFRFGLPFRATTRTDISRARIVRSDNNNLFFFFNQPTLRINLGRMDFFSFVSNEATKILIRIHSYSLLRNEQLNCSHFVFVNQEFQYFTISSCCGSFMKNEIFLSRECILPTLLYSLVYRSHNLYFIVPV